MKIELKAIKYAAGTEIEILPQWRDAGDEDYRWFALEDAAEGQSLRLRAVHKDPNHASHAWRIKPSHLVALDMVRSRSCES